MALGALFISSSKLHPRSYIGNYRYAIRLMMSAAHEAFDMSADGSTCAVTPHPKFPANFHVSSACPIGPSAGRRAVALNNGKRYFELSCA
jgi:hypothetical protein